MPVSYRVRILATAIVILTLCLCTPGCPYAAPQHFQTDQAPLKSASELNYPPFAIVLPNGQPDGFSVELLQAVCNTMRLPISFTVAPWHTIKQELADGKLDVLPLVSYSEERDAVFDFTAPYLRMQGTIFVRKGEDSIHDENDLKGKEVLVMRGDTAHEYALKKNLTNKLVLTETFLDAFRLLAEGKHDAVLVQKIVGWQILNKLHLKNVIDVDSTKETSLKPQAKPLESFEQKFCFAVKKGNSSLLAQLNEGLSIVIADGTYDKLYQKWFFKILPKEYISATEIAQYLLSIVIPFLLIISVAGVYILRQEIKKKTRYLLKEVNEREQIQDDLEEAKEKYRVLFESVIDPVLVAETRTGIIVECNQVAESFFGKSRSELIGMHQTQLQTGEAAPKETFSLSHEFKKQCEHPELTLEIPLHCAQDRIRLVSVQATRFHHKGEDLIMGVFRDVTEQKQILEALHKSETLLRKAQSIAHIGHWELDLRLNTLVWSEEVYNIFGMSPDEESITYELFLSFVHPEDRKAVDAVYIRSIREELNGYEINHRVIRKNDAAVRYVQEKCEHVKDTKGEVVLSIGTIQDTTEQSNTEMQLREALYNAELANKSKAIFLANMSHEIRTPLNGIMGMLQLLQHDNIAQNQLEYIVHAMNSGKRLTSLLSDILDLTKVDAGLLTIRSDPFDLNDLLQALSQLFSPAIKQKNLDFTIYRAPSVPTSLIGDPLRLQQVLSNIIGNATKFTESGSIALEIFPLPAAEPGQCKLLFSIADDGIGIPADKLDILFDAFTQVESSYTRNFQGAGLGLSISKNLITLMGGNISVASKPGEGTCFQFCVPFKIARSLPSERVKPQTTGILSSFNILLAEDDAVSQLAVAGLLKKMGQRVRLANNGEQALDAMRKERFDIVFMDIQMPVMEGLEATRAIRAGEVGVENKETPIVAMTAYAMVGDKEAFLEAGMNTYIPKPIHFEALEKILLQFSQNTAS